MAALLFGPLTADALALRCATPRMSLEGHAVGSVAPDVDVSAAAADAGSLLDDAAESKPPKEEPTSLDMTLAKEEVSRVAFSLGGVALSVAMAAGELALTTGVEVAKVGGAAAGGALGMALEASAPKSAPPKRGEPQPTPATAVESPSWLERLARDKLDEVQAEINAIPGRVAADVGRRAADSPRWMWSVYVAKRAEAEAEAEAEQVRLAIEEAREAAAKREHFASLTREAAAEAREKAVVLEGLKAKLARPKAAKWF